MRRMGYLASGIGTDRLCLWANRLASVYEDYRYSKRVENVQDIWLSVEHPQVYEQLAQMREEKEIQVDIPEDVGSGGAHEFTADSFLSFLGLDE